MSEDIDSVRRLAVARWRRRLVVPPVIGGVAGPQISPWLFGDTEHAHSVLASLIGAVVSTAVVLAIALVVLRWKAHLLSGSGYFAAPLSAGLPRRQRRAVMRAVRRAQPSDEPLLRLAEEETADRLLRFRRSNVVIFVGAIVLVGVEGLTDAATTAGRAYFGVAAFLLAAMLVWTLILQRRAAMYLDVASRSESRMAA